MAVWASGCGDSTGLRQADISGSWTYSATYQVSLGPLGRTTCSMSGVQVTVSQSGSTVSGTGHGGESLCDPPVFDLEPATPEDPIEIMGTVDENSVSLEADGFVPLSHVGTISGNLMSGTVTGTGSLPGLGSISVTGAWSASR